MALIVTVVCAATAIVFTVNVTEIFPAGTLTEVGGTAEVLLLESLTAMPPVGAGPLSVTVPVEEAPPVTAVGLRLSDTSEGGLIVSVADIDPDGSFPVIVAEVRFETPIVVTTNVPTDCP